MVRNSKQKWEVGKTVKVGFLTLIVKAAIPTPGDSLPDVYFLSNLAGDKLYEFTPHMGVRRVELDEVVERVAKFRKYCEQVAAADIARAQKVASISRKFAAVFDEVAA